MTNINILPKLSSILWSRFGDSTAPIEFTGDYSFNMVYTSNNDYFILVLKTTDLIPFAGKTIRIGFEQYTNNQAKSRLTFRIYYPDLADGATYLEYKYDQINALNQFDVIIKSNVTELRVYLRNTTSADYTTPITNILVGLYAYDMTPLPKLYFHKVLKENLPTVVNDIDEHIYFAFDGINTDMHISNKDGKLIPVLANTLNPSTTTDALYNNVYTQQAIDERFNTIKQLQNSSNITFTIATDIHIRGDEDTRALSNQYDNRYNQLKDFIMLTNQIPIDYVICTGDLLQEGVSHNGLIEKRIVNIAKIFREYNCPAYISRGNHDYNSSSIPENTVTQEMIISNKEWYNMMQRKLNETADIKIVNNKNNPVRGYYYVDDYINKHRMIFINSFEVRVDTNEVPYIDGTELDYSVSGIRSKQQIDWLLDEALIMTNRQDWIVSFFSHVVPYTDAGTGDITNFHGYGSDNQPLRLIIKAFMNGGIIGDMLYNVVDMTDSSWFNMIINKDFTSQGPIPVTGFYGGHCHDDCYIKIDGINCVISTSTCANQRTSWTLDPTPTKLPPERDLTNLSMSTNVFVINKKTRTVNVVKVGSKRDNTVVTSSDYSFTY